MLLKIKLWYSVLSQWLFTWPQLSLNHEARSNAAI